MNTKDFQLFAENIFRNSNFMFSEIMNMYCCYKNMSVARFLYRKYVSNNALVYVSLLILTHIVYCRFVLYDYYSCSVQNVPFIMLSPN